MWSDQAYLALIPIVITLDMDLKVLTIVSRIGGGVLWDMGLRIFPSALFSLTCISTHTPDTFYTLISSVQITIYEEKFMKV
jgi:hypothetical protein